MTFVKHAGWLALAGLLLLGAAPAGTTTPTAESALAELKAGNTRHAAHKYTHPHQTASRMTSLAGGQDPHAIILSCADSRVPPEIVFDRGLGDLFTVRVAGNIAGDAEIASIEYAVEHLHVPLIVVLGHRRCGAIAAAREIVTSHAHAEGHLQSLVDALRPAVEATPGQDAESTCQANVREVVAALRASEPVLASRVQSGAVAVIGAYYDLETGAIRVLAD